MYDEFMDDDQEPDIQTKSKDVSTPKKEII